VGGGEKDDKVSKVMTCSFSLGPFVLAHPERRKLAISSGFFISREKGSDLERVRKGRTLPPSLDFFVLTSPGRP